MNTTTKTQKPQNGGVFISPNPVKTKIMIDKDGNEIDPKTKEIIKKNQDTEEK